MNDPAQSDAKYEDLFDLLNNQVGEILDGQLHTSPRPAPAHAGAYSALGYRIGGPFDGGIGVPGGWWILDEPEIHLGADVVAPDLAGWRRERMPGLSETAWFELVSDWACEILSPSPAQVDRSIKMPLYTREGVKHLRLVDPALRTLEAYTLSEADQWTLLQTLSNDDPVQVPPL